MLFLGRSMDKELYIVDTFGFLFRTYYAIPPLYNRDGFPTNLLTGFVKLVQQFQKLFSIQNIVFTLESETNFRKEISKSYKSNRDKTIPEDFKKQAEIILSWIDKIGFPTIRIANYEADDIIASIAKQYSKKGYRIYILSEDKDFIQLLNENIYIIKPSTMELFGIDDAIQRFGIHPSKFVYYQALVGDKIDNISGVPGIGPKWATKLLTQFQSLKDIYNNLDRVNTNIAKKLDSGRDYAFQSLKLVTLKDDLNIPPLSTTSSISNEPLSMIVDDLIKYELDSALKYLIKQGIITREYIEKREEKNFQFQNITIIDINELQKIIRDIPENSLVAFDTETTGADIWTSNIVGFSFAYEYDKGYYIPIDHNYLGAEQIEKEELQTILEEFQRFRIIGHNFKFDRHIIYKSFGVDIAPFADTMILAWLLHPTEKLSLDDLSYRLLKHKKIKFKDIMPKKGNFADVDIDIASRYSVEDSIATLRLFEKLQELLPNRLFEMGIGLENRISAILYKMEREGIEVDIDYLNKLEIETKERLDTAQNRIYEFAGEEFNLNSPKQVGNILYGKLQIPSRTKKTDEITLKSIGGRYPIIEKLLEYREEFKLLTTYIRPLKSYGEIGRVHTTFIQTGTATGRLSSKNPNLQNIPTGSKIRNSFIAKDGYMLLSLDYSQIELRLLAHFSEDKKLIEIFQNGGDIHSIVAQQLEVDRRIAKTVNFGIIYGMGYKKLGSTLQISDNRAREILERYFSMFPGISKFRQKFLEQFEKDLYVETLLKRKRYFHQPNSKREKEAISREAFNTIFQGSTADIVKMAMVEIDREIEISNLPAKLLLQIHDELIIEVAKENLSDIQERFKSIMKNVYTLKVPLIVNSKSGKRWGEMR